MGALVLLIGTLLGVGAYRGWWVAAQKNIVLAGAGTGEESGGEVALGESVKTTVVISRSCVMSLAPRRHPSGKNEEPVFVRSLPPPHAFSCGGETPGGGCVRRYRRLLRPTRPLSALSRCQATMPPG